MSDEEELPVSDAMSQDVIDDFNQYIREKQLPLADAVGLGLYILATSVYQAFLEMTDEQKLEYMGQITKALGANLTASLQYAISEQCQSRSKMH